MAGERSFDDGEVIWTVGAPRISHDLFETFHLEGDPCEICELAKQAAADQQAGKDPKSLLKKTFI